MKSVNFEKVVWEKKKLEEKHKPRKKCKIYIFRHAQTYYNRDHKFTGWVDSKLTPLGIRQSKKVSKMMKDKKIDVAFRTRLSRSHDTLKEVMKYHPECFMLVQDDRMIERNYGDWQHKSHTNFIHKEGTDDYKTLLHWHKIDHLHGEEREAFVKTVGEAELKIIRRSYNHPPPNGESVKMVCDRVNDFLKDLIKFIKVNKVNVALSAHGNSMRPFRKYFEKFSVHDMMHLENPWDDYFEYEIKV
ncbi:histidine phosphatase family protein [Candidatus Woesearchaeota archaeon]|nr:histidine phosphatase family protein [Candidatus Woesearchaeota archaeon]